MTRVLVFGSRDWTDRYAIWCILNGYASDGFGVTVVNGGARGADSIAKQWAALNNQSCETCQADWGQYGKAAGPKRNQRMLEEAEPDVAWGFVTKDLEQSRGSADMARRTRLAGVPTYVVRGFQP